MEHHRLVLALQKGAPVVCASAHCTEARWHVGADRMCVCCCHLQATCFVAWVRSRCLLPRLDVSCTPTTSTRGPTTTFASTPRATAYVRLVGLRCHAATCTCWRGSWAQCSCMQVSDKIVCYNLDARVFIRKVAAQGLKFAHAVMNLPADAIEFTGAQRAHRSPPGAASRHCVVPSTARRVHRVVSWPRRG